ncbi:hypothetical protein [Halorussus pelagicus]|uniref:hypothetical protein n=1 Tax=Halorussus pelagicus TaxID=2505977 RepID=UPI000FFBEBB8|nr:hypothetical protein [Halorussus pelagicus]
MTDRTPEATLASVLVVNDRKNPVEVAVRIDKDGSTQYQETHRISGQDADDNATEIETDWMGDQVPYSITVKVVHATVTKTYTTSDAEEDVSDWGGNTCFDTAFTIEPSDIRVSIGASEDC